MESHNDNLPLSKFELMLKTNRVLFFDSEEFESIIHHYLNQGKISLAKKALTLGLNQHPSSINIRLFKVEIYIIDDKLDKADALLDILHNIDPTNEEIYIQKANVFSKRDNHKQATQALKAALKLTDDPIDIYTLLGMEYLFLEDYEASKACFIHCLDFDPTDYGALHNVIYCFDYLSQHEDAVDYLTKYLDTNPYSETAWHQLGKQYITLNDYEKALTALDFAIISDNRFVGAYLERGKVLEQLNRYEDAIENYQTTLELDDPTTFATLRIGYCYEKLNDNDQAINYYYKTIHEDPMLAKGWIAISHFYKKQNNYKKSLYYINKAINIDSENPTYWKSYAQIAHRLGLFEEAEYGYQKTLEFGNYELNAWLSRGDLLIRLDDLKAAISNFEKAQEFHPENAEIAYRLAGLYLSLNEKNKGLFFLKNGLLYNPEYKFIIAELFPNIANETIVKKLLKNNSVQQ